MASIAGTTVYSFDIGEQTFYFFDQAEAEQAYAQAEQRAEYPDWRESMTLSELLAIKDDLLGEFAKRIAFLELQLERAELGDSFDLGKA